MKHFFVLSSFNPGAILQMLNSYPPDLTTEATTLFPVFPESLLCFQQQINLLSGAISTLRTLPHSFYSCSCFHGLLSSLVQVIFPPPNPTTSSHLSVCCWLHIAPGHEGVPRSLLPCPLPGPQHSPVLQSLWAPTPRWQDSGAGEMAWGAEHNGRYYDLNDRLSELNTYLKFQEASIILAMPQGALGKLIQV